MKDAAGPTMMFTGGGLTLTPVVIIQLVGAIVGVVGVILTAMKLRQDRINYQERVLSRLEQKRANDIEERRLNHEIGVKDNASPANKQQTS